MEITEVRIKLMDDAGDRLRAFCSITFDDCFVIRDLKIIEGANGPFVAMPSRKLTSRCPQCGCKNHLRAAYCNQCGLRLKDDRAIRDESGRAKLYADIAHPINSSCRERLQTQIIEAFHEETVRAQQPGYVSRYDELDDGEDFDFVETDHAPRTRGGDAEPTVAPAASDPRSAPTRRPNTHQHPGHGNTGPHTRSGQSVPSVPSIPGVPVQRPAEDFGAGVFED